MKHKILILCGVVGGPVAACAPDAGLTRHNSAPTATILSPADGAVVVEGEEIELRGAAGDPDDSAADLVATWFVDDVEQCSGPPDEDQTTTCPVRVPVGPEVAVRLEVIDPVGSAETDAIVVEVEPALDLGLSVSLSPPAPDTQTVLTATAVVQGVDWADASLVYTWSVDGSVVMSGPQHTLDGNLFFDRGQVVQVVVEATVQEATATTTSAPVLVVNSEPVSPGIRLDPGDPVEGDALTCAVSTESWDADDDPLTYQFSWTVDGSSVPGTADDALESTVDGTVVGALETWTCTVVADDGDALSEPVSASVVTGESCDLDGDGYDGGSCGGPDCDDADPAIHPKAGDTYGDGIDHDCDGLDCEATWSGSVYFTVCAQVTSISAADAENTCIAAGYDGLSIPLDATENEAIAWLNETLWPLRPLDNHNVRLGGTDEAVEGTWVHTRTGALMTYLNWGGGEPTNSYGDEHCIDLVGDPSWSGQWQDLGCFAGSNSDTAYSCEAR